MFKVHTISIKRSYALTKVARKPIVNISERGGLSFGVEACKLMGINRQVTVLTAFDPETKEQYVALTSGKTGYSPVEIKGAYISSFRRDLLADGGQFGKFELEYSHVVEQDNDVISFFKCKPLEAAA